MNLFNLKNKTIVIVGAGRGLGLELSNYLIKQGAKIIGIDQKFNSNNFSKKFIIDLNKITSLKKKIEIVTKKLKIIDGLVFCAGITKPNKKFNSFDVFKFNEVFRVNLQSAYIVNYVVANHMLKKKIKGSIINFTSIGAHQAFPENPYYTSSKGALRHLTKSFAYDYGPKNIRFNNIVPGYFKTPMNKKTLSSKKKITERSNRNLLLRWGKPLEICGGVHFLLSDASSYITATDLVIDGGWLTKGI